MGTIKSKIGRKFEQKRKAKWVKEKANLVKAYLGTMYYPGKLDSPFSVGMHSKVDSSPDYHCHLCIYMYVVCLIANTLLAHTHPNCTLLRTESGRWVYF